MMPPLHHSQNPLDPPVTCRDIVQVWVPSQEASKNKPCLWRNEGSAVKSGGVGWPALPRRGTGEYRRVGTDSFLPDDAGLWTFDVRLVRGGHFPSANDSLALMAWTWSLRSGEQVSSFSSVITGVGTMTVVVFVWKSLHYSFAALCTHYARLVCLEITDW